MHPIRWEVESVSDLIARTFIIGFTVIYGSLVVFGLIWALRKWFGSRSAKGAKKDPSHHHLSHLRISHDHHNAD